MVKMPKEFVQLDRYPGYYWSTEEKHLYSIKVTGILHKMTKSKGFVGHTKFGFINAKPGYRISRNGCRGRLDDATIERLVAKADKKQKFPVEK